jgi:hypothetical protein
LEQGAEQRYRLYLNCYCYLVLEIRLSPDVPHYSRLHDMGMTS